MIFDKILNNPFVPVYSNSDSELVLSVVESCIAAQITCFELTDRTENTEEIFLKIKNRFPQLTLGLGSVLSEETAKKYAGLGADFIVSPGFSKNILKGLKDSNTIYIPGVASASEIMLAHSKLSKLNYSKILLKIFPADCLGIKWFKAVQAPLYKLNPKVNYMATGGINSNNAREWLNAGASNVGIGSDIFNSEDLASKNFDRIIMNLKKLTQI